MKTSIKDSTGRHDPACPCKNRKYLSVPFLETCIKTAEHLKIYTQLEKEDREKKRKLPRLVQGEENAYLLYIKP